MTGTRMAGSVLAIGLVLTACGSGGGGGGNGEADKSANQILSDAVSALRSAKTFHLAAKSNSTGADALGIDIDLVSGGSARGTVTTGGASARIVASGGKFYIQGRDFWNKFGGPEAATVVGDRWAILPSNADTTGFLIFVNSDTLATCLAVSHGTLSKGGSATVDGQGAVVLVDEGDKPGTTPAKLYVATTGTAYPIRLESTGTTSAGATPGGDKCNTGGGSSGSSSSNGGGIFTLSQFNATVTITPPPNPLDLSTLGG